MREMIKFRAYLIEDKKMLTVTAIEWFPFEDEFTIDGFDGADHYGALTNLEVNLMQYTGQKDKNGKEGYHKDIVDHDTYGNGTIEWYKNGWAIDFKGLAEDEHWFELALLIDCEIIGNIYENPELLEK